MTPARRGALGTIGRSLRPGRPTRGDETLAYVIAEPCIGQKDNSCVEVCPVDCIHPTPDEPDYDQVEQLYIDPEECIDCDARVEACPVDACFAEDQLPDEWQKYTQINLDYYKQGILSRPTGPESARSAFALRATRVRGHRKRCARDRGHRRADGACMTARS